MDILKHTLKSYITLLKEDGLADIKYHVEENENIKLIFSFFNIKNINTISFSLEMPYNESLDEVIFDSLTMINTLNLSIELNPEDSLMFDVTKNIILSSNEMLLVAENFLNNILDLEKTEGMS